ncbi:MAG: carboxypeptidase-like regulatory domain-containing protein [Terriglobia bacterium]
MTKRIPIQPLMRTAVLFAAYPLVSLGQSTAQLTGAISDPSGAAIPNTQITVINVDTGIRTKTTSNQLGYYTVSLLPPGNYRVDVETEGFRPITRSGIVLQVNQVARIDFSLELGTVSERVQVVESAPVVERETAALGAVIDNRKIVNLPLNGRNPYALALLVPGVVPSTRDITRGVGSFITSASFQVNGGRVNTSAFSVDGVNNTTTWSESFNVVPTMPSVEAVQEFKV